MSLEKKYKILIADKSGGASFLLTSVLASYGFDIFTVNSYLKAIEYCQNESYTPNMIIVELVEPCAIFYEFPRKFLERTGKSIPILCQSVNTDKNVILKALQSGYKDYLIRPVEPEILLDKISNILSPEVKLSEKTFKYFVNEAGSLVLPVHLNYINEFGIDAYVGIEPKLGDVLSIKSPVLERSGLSSIDVRVVSYNPEKDVHGKPIFKVNFSFVGVKPNDIAKIRKIAMFKGELEAA